MVLSAVPSQRAAALSADNSLHRSQNSRVLTKVGVRNFPMAGIRANGLRSMPLTNCAAIEW